MIMKSRNPIIIFINLGIEGQVVIKVSSAQSIKMIIRS